MISKEAQAFLDFYKGIAKSMTLAGQDLVTTRKVMESLHECASEPSGVLYEEVKWPGTVKPAIWCLPLQASPSHVTLYIHGGGGIGGSPSSHRKLGGHLAKASATKLLLLDYRLAPENPFPAAIEDIVLAYKHLLDQGTPAANITLAGDSAGAGHVLNAVRRIKKSGTEQPAAIVAISPFVDMELTGASMVTNASKDVVASKEQLGAMAGLILSGTSPKDPDVNVLTADLTGFPPLYVVTGTYEVLMDDAARLVDKAKKSGVEVTYEVGEEMQHDHVFMAGRAPEANKTITNIGAWIKKKLSLS